MKTETVIEDNQGNVIGFWGEQTKVENGKNRGDETQVVLLAPDKTFHRSHILKVDPAQLGVVNVAELPAFMGKGANLQSPEELRLFEPVEAAADVGGALAEELAKRVDLSPKKPGPARR